MGTSLRAPSVAASAPSRAAGEHAIDALARDGWSGEFRDCFFELLAIRGDAVPAGLILHERNALALHGVGDDHGGIAVMRGGGFERAEDFVEIVAVDFDHVPAERGVFRGERLDVHDVFDPAVDLQAIAVHDGAEIVELVVRCGHHGFPDAAFLMFAIAHDAEDAMGFDALPGCESAADGDAESLAERAAGNFHARELQAIGMAFEAGAEAAERNCVFERKIAGAAE